MLEIKNARVYVNGAPAVSYPHSKLNYLVRTNGRTPAVDDNVELLQMVNNNVYVYNLANDQVAAVKKAPNVVSADLYLKRSGGCRTVRSGRMGFSAGHCQL